MYKTILAFLILFYFSFTSHAQWMSIKILSPYVSKSAVESVDLFFGTDWQLESIGKTRVSYFNNSFRIEQQSHAIFFTEWKDYWDSSKYRRVQETSIQIQPNYKANYDKYLGEILSLDFSLVEKITRRNDDEESKEKTVIYSLYRKDDIGIITILSLDQFDKYVFSLIELFNFNNQDIIDVMFYHSKEFVGQSNEVRDIND